jgi:membrane associated rhomboid family serine protease
MAICPLCVGALQTVRQREGIYFHCRECGGRAVTVPQVRRVAGDRFATALLRQINAAAQVASRLCPFCRRPMKLFHVHDPELTLDSCKTCGAVWFDPAEFEALPQKVVEPVQEVEMRGREIMALKKIEHMAKVERAANACPDESWKWVPGFLGMPVELDPSPSSRLPLLTWTVASVIVMVSLAAFLNFESVVQTFGMIPAEFWRYGGATTLTSFFLHGGILHLVGNVYFLLLVGDNVEDYLGRGRFLLLLLLATVAGDLLHVAAAPGSTVPCVGASGGISGLMAFYALAFPRARLGFLLHLRYTYLRWIQMPAWGAFVLWVLFELFGIWQQISGFTNVSSAAHIGGATVGFLFWLHQRK